MKTLFIFIIALALSVFVALLVKQDPGYVLISVGDLTVETTFAVFVVLLTLLLITAYVVLRLLVSLVRTPARVARWSSLRGERRADKLTAQGAALLAEGRYRVAEQKFEKSLEKSRTPLLGYLGAAEAAQGEGDLELRDKMLNKAYNKVPEAKSAITFTEARLLIEQGDFEGAIRPLGELYREFPRDSEVLRLLAETYRARGDWKALWQILPDLRKRKALPDGDLRELELQTHKELLQAKAEGSNVAEVLRFWKDVPKHLREEPELLTRYAVYLENAGAAEQAERLLRTALDRHWDDRLVTAYGELGRADAGRQLTHVEAWLRSRPDDGNLLLAAGRIGRRGRQWAKARGYLEGAVRANAHPVAYQELGGLLEQMDEFEAARQCFRHGIQLLTGVKLTSGTDVLEAPAEAARMEAGQTQTKPVGAAAEPRPA